MIKKGIILTAGLGTRFLPLSKAISKPFLPLADKPAIQYVLEEAVNAGLKEIIFIVSPHQEEILKYFQKSPKLEKILQERKKDHILKEVRTLNSLSENLSFTSVVQREPLGDGHAVLQARKLIGKDESVAVFFSDDIIDAKTPSISQLCQMFKTCQKPIVALKKMPQEKLIHYGIVQAEKIASRFYKIKRVVEKPSIESAPSDLAVVGRSILTPEVLDYLKKLSSARKEELLIVDALEAMVRENKLVYGYEIEGEWLECGDKARWLASNLYFSLKHPEFGPKLKKFLKEIK